ncbi:hypothetical protein [Hyphomonas jannaschiana]|uniref:Uncharacterized protein n=1 Tax=Hyphomonas jannaschiana VP2 TaxID=1280952 RepID=A0A059F854_9PROT|nr:hypothetical protein [Hyphomonas jannaschiana]KCZ86772.1 hypothetical protein HJA_14264 [Hyphomonas jannaschiana VP2]
MPVSFKVGLLAVVASVFALESHACRIYRPFDPDKLQADLVLRGQVISYIYPDKLAEAEGGAPTLPMSSAILCVRTLDTYFGEVREKWCFDVDSSTFSPPDRRWIPDDVIVAANAFSPEDNEIYIRNSERWFGPLGVEMRVFNAGCTEPYLIAYDPSAERQMIERLVRLGFTTSESETGR